MRLIVSWWDILWLFFSTIIMAVEVVINVISMLILKVGWAFGALLVVASTLSLFTTPSTSTTINIFLLISGLILIVLSLILNYHEYSAEKANYSPEP